jgi:ribosomal-protein-alanine N-acetyltransferase
MEKSRRKDPTSKIVSDTTPAKYDLAFEPLQEEHALALFEPFQDESMYRFIPEQPPESLQWSRRDFELLAAGPADNSEEVWLNWAIRDNASARYLGTVQATLFADGLLWVGYKLAPVYWNRGVATRAVKWLVSELNGRYPNCPIHASVDTRNHASIRVLEKVGFQLTGKEAAEIDGLASEDFIYKIEPDEVGTCITS